MAGEQNHGTRRNVERDRNAQPISTAHRVQREFQPHRQQDDPERRS